MPRPRFQPPDQLPGATAFTLDDAVLGSLTMVEMLKQQRWLAGPLEQACDLSMNWGRPRTEGRWELVAVAFVLSGRVDIKPWHDDTGHEIWQACGFESKPAYGIVRRRLRELEACEDALIDAIASLVQRARRHDPRVGAHVHVDGTEDATHAALVHDCAPGEPCRRPQGRRRARAMRPERVTTDVARARRQEENAGDPDAVPEPVAGDTEIVERNGKTIKRIRQGGCWYRTLDTEAGIRAYTGERGARKFWHGYYNQKGIDHFTGGVLFPGVYSASAQEYHQLPDLYAKLTRVIGAAPETIIADKGQSVTSVFELLTRGGTAAVIPWRAAGGDRQRHDRETHDRHGVPRCRHCGAASRFRRFSSAGQAPRLGYRCLAPATPECERHQSIACSQDWRLLLPLWRTDPLYHELRESHALLKARTPTGAPATRSAPIPWPTGPRRSASAGTSSARSRPA